MQEDSRLYPLDPALTPTQDFTHLHDGEGSVTEIEDSTFSWMVEVKEQATLMWPIVVSSVLEYLPGLICTILVGHIDDGRANLYVSAATLSQMINRITCLSIGFGMTTALDTLCSQAFGAGCVKKIGIYLQSGCLVVGAMVVPMFLLNWFTEDLLLLVGQEHEVSRLAGEFSRINVFGMPFLLLYELLRKLLQAQNIVRPMVVIAVISDLVNVLAGYFLTYSTSLGFHGAAVAGMLGSVIMPLSLVAYMIWTKTYQAWWPGWNLHEAKAHAGLFLHLGFPGMLMLVMEWASYQLMALMAGLLPDSVVAISAHAVVVNYSSTIYMVYLGISVAACIRIGNALGSNRPKHARSACFVALSMVTASAAILATISIVFRYGIPKVLVNDAIAAERAAKLMPLIAVFSISDGINGVMQAIFRGMGQQKVAVWSNLVGFYVIGLTLSWVCGFPLHWGLAGIWAGCLIGTIANELVLGAIICKTDWQKRANEAQARTK